MAQALRDEGFIVEQTGKILLLKGGAVAPDPFLGISSHVSGGSEQGLLGLAVRFWHQPFLFFAIAAVVYAVAYYGLNNSFARFPWELPWLQKSSNQPATSTMSRYFDPDNNGWPFGYLMPMESAEFLRPRRELICRIGMLALWLHVALTLIPDVELRSHWAIVVLAIAAITSLRRLAVYMIGCVPPLSFFGRLSTGRLIIPAYDKVFVAPMLALIVCTFGIERMLTLGRAARYAAEISNLMDIIAPLALAVSVLITFGVGPSLRNWRLTGAHRIAPLPDKRFFERVS